MSVMTYCATVASICFLAAGSICCACAAAWSSVIVATAAGGTRARAVLAVELSVIGSASFHLALNRRDAIDQRLEVVVGRWIDDVDQLGRRRDAPVGEVLRERGRVA